MPKDPPLPSDLHLWESEIEKVNPLKQNKTHPRCEAQPKQSISPPPSPTSTPTKTNAVAPPPLRGDQGPRGANQKREQSQHHKPNRATERQLKNGAIPLTAKLDLHGLTVVEAHHAFLSFINHHHQSHPSAWLLIIHGKGRNNEGKIKQNIKTWMEDSPHINITHPAHAKHGGEGATYIKLRKN